MKKLFKFFALALMAVVTMSCSEEKSDVLYKISLVIETNQAMGSISSDYSIYDQFINCLKKLKKLEADWQTQIKNNTNPDVKMFELSRTLELKRYVGSTGETSTLKSYSISLSLK